MRKLLQQLFGVTLSSAEDETNNSLASSTNNRKETISESKPTENQLQQIFGVDNELVHLDAIRSWTMGKYGAKRQKKADRLIQLLEVCLCNSQESLANLVSISTFEDSIHLARRERKIGFFQARVALKVLQQYRCILQSKPQLNATRAAYIDTPTFSRNTHKEETYIETNSLDSAAQDPSDFQTTARIMEVRKSYDSITNTPVYPQITIESLFNTANEDATILLEPEFEPTNCEASDMKIHGAVSNCDQLDYNSSFIMFGANSEYGKTQKKSNQDSLPSKAKEAEMSAKTHARLLDDNHDQPTQDAFGSSLEISSYEDSTDEKTPPDEQLNKEDESDIIQSRWIDIEKEISIWPRQDKVWTLGEWALLLDWHLKYINLTSSQRQDQLRILSRMLRSSAKQTYFQMEDKYRNEAGINAQYSSLKNYLRGAVADHKYAMGMEQVVKLYRQDKEQFDLLLNAFKERIAASNRSVDGADGIADSVSEISDKEFDLAPDDWNDVPEQADALIPTEIPMVPYGIGQASIPDEVVGALNILYPDKRYPTKGIVQELYAKSKVPRPLAVQIREQLENPKRMHKIGFRPVETEMRSYTEKPYLAPGYEALEPVLNQAFYSQPLLGNITPTSEQRSLLYQSAIEILNQVLRHGRQISIVQRDILVLETVMLLQRWNQQTDDKQDTTFWAYIFSQYGLRYDMSDFSNSKAYRMFRDSIEISMRRHNRLIAGKGKRYYTTMLTHAMAPRDKFFDLFEQIFGFYSKNLRYQYISDDPAFTAFSLAMKRRFDSPSALWDDSVYIKSVQSSSAIVLLFSMCPYYMADFVDITVRLIDGMVAGREISVESYLHELLRDWYALRNQEVREQDRGKRQVHSLDRTVTDFRNIKPLYLLRDNQLLLSIPSIRLGEQLEELPVLFIYYHDQLLHTQKLLWYGDQFCITTINTEVNIGELFSGSEDFACQVIITYGGEELYNSEAILNRVAVVFSEHGVEVNSRPDVRQVAYLFAPHNAKVDEQIENALQCERLVSSGQLYRVVLMTATEMIVNGHNLFPSIVTAGDLVIETPPASNKLLNYLYQQTEHTVYTQAPVLYVTVANNREKQYRVVVDGEISALASFSFIQNRGWKIVLPGEGTAHDIRLVDNETQKAVYSLHYVVWPDFELSFHGYQSFISDVEGHLTVNDRNGEQFYSYNAPINDNRMFLRYQEGELVVKVPQLRCLLDGKDILLGDQNPLWYEDLPAASVMRVLLPSGYLAAFYLGNRCFTSEVIEIGNICRGYQPESVAETLRIGIFHAEDLLEEIDLVRLVFEPYFKAAPLVVSRRELKWLGAKNYIGNKNAHFLLTLQHVTGNTNEYEVELEEKVLESYFQPSEGVYQYSVILRSESFFEHIQKEIYRGRLIIGDPIKLRFMGRILNVTRAYLMDHIESQTEDIVEFGRGSVVMTGLEYMGTTALNGESLIFPCYQGTLRFLTQGRYLPYSDRDISRKVKAKYQVNPVLVWIINEQLIALRTLGEDGLLVDKEWKTISHYVPNKYNQKNFLMPDYYGYHVMDEEEMEIV